MASGEILDLARTAIYVLLQIVTPVLLAALTVGIVVGLLQALTQIQEMTLVFVPKIFATFIVLLLTLPFIGHKLGGLMHMITDYISAF